MTDKDTCSAKSCIPAWILIAPLVLALALAYAGWQVKDGLQSFNSADRVVTVKGLAQQDVKATLALWPISYTETGNDLTALQNEMDAKGQRIMTFLKQYGIEENEVELQQVNVQDVLANAYRNNDGGANRYILTQGYMVRTNKVDDIARAAQNVGALVKQGVVLANNGSGPTYLFTGLNDIKPQMIADATKNAREAAEQFAADSGENVGGIKRANQGVFQILARDDTYMLPEQNQLYKTVRVVSTIDFYLE